MDELNELQLPDTSPRDVKHAAMKMLSNREHSCQELQQKLKRKGFKPPLIEQIVAELRDEGLVNDKRFAEAYTRSRSGRGYGPYRIQQELKQRGTSEDIINEVVQIDHQDWQDLAAQVRIKRFGGKVPKDLNEKAKQLRFLQYRGFTGDQQKYALSDIASDNNE